MADNHTGQLPFIRIPLSEGSCTISTRRLLFTHSLPFDRHARVRVCVCVWVLFFSISLSLSLLPSSQSRVEGERESGRESGFSECAQSFPFLGYASMKHSFTIDLVGYGQELDLQIARLQVQQSSFLLMSSPLDYVAVMTS